MDFFNVHQKMDITLNIIQWLQYLIMGKYLINNSKTLFAKTLFNTLYIYLYKT